MRTIIERIGLCEKYNVDWLVRSPKNIAQKRGNDLSCGELTSDALARRVCMIWVM